MEPHSTTFLQLLTAYLTDELREEQRPLFTEMLLDPANQQLLEEAIDSLASERAVNGAGNTGMQARSLQLLQQKIDALPEKVPAPVRVMTAKKWIAAAVAVAMVVTGTWYLLQHRISQQELAGKEIPVVHGNDLDPGKDGAILVLADGRKLLLDTMKNGTITREKGAELLLSNGTLSYDVNDTTIAAKGFNTISTPRGRQIQLGLPDGTRAWLNAGSSLRFPAAFSGKERLVEMSGEVYFEVKKDATHPFRVKAGTETFVEVLGTAFNVNAYENESGISTTLAEGSVKMQYGGASSILKPGEQASTSKTRPILVKTVDVSEVTAWKEGRFEFEGNIQDIMRQLQRWYNINEVEYTGGTENRMLGATISRSKKLSEVLALLAGPGSVHFTIEGEKVIVKP
ncbi:MAG: FecR family protein [Pseudobacter sp.]|uniref:FecR family protein n=1 Tax=Pseudobacter sp. TaxID=2045420 RepID=UPI003F81D125